MTAEGNERDACQLRGSIGEQVQVRGPPAWGEGGKGLKDLGFIITIFQMKNN